MKVGSSAIKGGGAMHKRQRAEHQWRNESRSEDKQYAPSSRSPAPLPSSVVTRLERAFGHSFADVAVHADAQADRDARALGALAFASGREISFRSDAFAPETPQGFFVLAHEAAHLVQQDVAEDSTASGRERDQHASSAPSLRSHGYALDVEPSREHEANQSALAALAGVDASIVGTTSAGSSADANQAAPVAQPFVADQRLEAPTISPRWFNWDAEPGLGGIFGGALGGALGSGGVTPASREGTPSSSAFDDWVIGPGGARPTQSEPARQGKSWWEDLLPLTSPDWF
jgi:hypothetical protein